MNIRLQDVSVIINGTSRYNGNQYDTVHVETLLVMDEPIPSEETWYVPNGNSVPPEVLNFFKISGIDMNPKKASTILAGTEDIQTESEEGNLQGVIEDSARFMLRAILKKAPLTPISGSPNTYLLSYDYKIYPINNSSDYEFTIRVPFDGLKIAENGGRVQLSIITPIGAQIDESLTKGIDENGQEISELVVPVSNVNRQIVSFAYQIDPDFTVRYRY
ncbi:hypothetical protein COJ46_21890 [Bacillus sp. AFS077874]|uniref:hypothetical protein n=1 Tax=unclassified Bacillus (in: firmicutes) TaxID=185979 RepID=UPI000BF46039|nr:MULTISPECIES: hypothetical protein [unclassified Bacillus (in: firmicutes)]PET71580.1 hypothetical protein CN514_06625 [Bacillus sp. AFS001701]PFM75317.1 hypothetical protein COJ46_21890 [Bacillus sp. AFS077874]